MKKISNYSPKRDWKFLLKEHEQSRKEIYLEEVKNLSKVDHTEKARRLLRSTLRKVMRIDRKLIPSYITPAAYMDKRCITLKRNRI